MSAVMNAIKEVPIGEFCQTGSGGTPARAKARDYYGGTIPWVKSGELRESVITTTEETITEAGLRESAAKLLPPHTLLVALYGATVGRIGILGIEAATNQAVCYIIPDKNRADRRYLYYALQSKVPHWLSQRVGGGQPNISQAIIRDTPIPLPPLSEQRRIADILDKADAIRRKRREAVEAIPQIARTALNQLLSTVRAHSGSERAIEDIADVQGGLALSAKRRDMALEMPYLRVANVYRDRLDLTEVKSIGLSEQEYEKCQLLRGDVLIVEGHGNREEIGRAAVWDGSIDNCVHQNHLIRARAYPQVIRPEYLSAYLNSKRGRAKLMRHGKTTSGLNTISISNVRSTTIEVPDLRLQAEFANTLNAANALRERLTCAFKQDHALFNVLVQRAFRGGL